MPNYQYFVECFHSCSSQDSFMANAFKMPSIIWTPAFKASGKCFCKQLALGGIFGARRLMLHWTKKEAHSRVEDPLRTKL